MQCTYITVHAHVHTDDMYIYSKCRAVFRSGRRCAAGKRFTN